MFLFWWSSHNNWSYFSKKKALESLKELTENYIFWDLDIDDFGTFKRLVKGKITTEDVCEQNKVVYDEYMEYIVDYYKEIKNFKNLNEVDKIQLIDKAIHIQHSMGTLLGGESINIPKLRQQFEDEYL